MLRALTLTMALALAAPPLAAETYDVRLLGIRVGELVTRLATERGQYAATGSFHTTGLADALAGVFFEMKTTGFIAPDGSLDPGSYAEEMDQGAGHEASSIRFGVEDARVDPLTAMLRVTAARPVSAGCAIDVEVFDGLKGHRLHLAPAAPGDPTRCVGGYDRTVGYTSAELAKRAGYNLVVSYARQGDQLVLAEVRGASVIGAVTLRPAN